MKCEDRARRWLADWVPGHGEAAVKALTHEFAVAQAEALLEGLKAVEEPRLTYNQETEPVVNSVPLPEYFKTERGPGGIAIIPTDKDGVPTHEPWPNRHNTPTGQTWSRGESDIEMWP